MGSPPCAARVTWTELLAQVALALAAQPPARPGQWQLGARTSGRCRVFLDIHGIFMVNSWNIVTMRYEWDKQMCIYIYICNWICMGNKQTILGLNAPPKEM